MATTSPLIAAWSARRRACSNISAPNAPAGPVPPSKQARIDELVANGDARTLEEDKEFLELTGGR